MAAAAALAVTDELVLPLRAVGDLAAAAGVSREEVVVITQCASLGEPPLNPLPSPFPCSRITALELNYEGVKKNFSRARLESWAGMIARCPSVIR
jgi:hypothetical protein